MSLLLALLLFLQSPPATQHGQITKKIENIKEPDPPKQQPSSYVSPLHNSSGQPSPPNTDSSKPNTKNDMRDWINAFSTAIIACLTFVTAFVIARQLRATHRQERAWVVIEELDPPEELSFWLLTEPINIEMRYVFKNYGSTPARLTDSRLVFKLIDRIEDLPATPDYGEKQPYPNFPKDGGILVPEAAIPIHTMFQGPSSSELTNDVLTSIRNESKCLVSYGFVKYRDAFHKKHETRFCHKYFVTKGFNYFSGDFLVAGPPAYNKHT